MTIVEALRKITAKEGMKTLFSDKLEKCILALDNGLKKEADRFATAYKSGAMEHLRAACNEAWEWEKYFELAKCALIGYDMDESVAIQTVGYFGEAFGFPGYCKANPALQGKLVSKTDESEFVYEGDVVDGKENGVGKRTYYYNGRLVNKDESIWIEGEMYGYWVCYELAFECVEMTKIGFIYKDDIQSERITYDDGEVETNIYTKI